MAYPVEKTPKNAYMNTQLLDEGLRHQFEPLKTSRPS